MKHNHPNHSHKKLSPKKLSQKLRSPRARILFAGAALAISIFAVFSLFLVPGVNAETRDVRTTPYSFSTLAETVSPAVINIRTEKTIKGGGVFHRFHRGPFGKDDPLEDFFEKFFGGDSKAFKQRSLGSGFIIDKDGYIVTNNHVVENADEITVKLKNGKEFDAEIVGRDAKTDIALIKIASGLNLPVVGLGDSQAIKIGEWVVAIGNPFGLEHTLTAGIVSAKGRVIGSGPYDNFIQTDASINPGNSGGPLINMEGEVVGINTAIQAGGQGIGFAIPINLAKGIIEQLKAYGDVTRGWIGVVIQDLSDELSEYYGIEKGKGALVAEVVPGDPADKAGIKPKDIILGVDGKPVDSSRDLSRMIADIVVGKTIDINVLRDGKKKTLQVQIAKRTDAPTLATGPAKEKGGGELGVRVSKMTDEIARRFNIKEAEGVIVMDIAPGSKGGEAGIEPGDIIKEINHHTIKTVEEYTETIKKIKTGETIAMFIKRINRGFLVIKLTK